MNLAALVNYMDSIGLGTSGEDLFYSALPDNVMQGILVIQMTPIQIDAYVSALRRGAFTVVVRDISLDAAHDRLVGVSDALRQQGLVIDGMNFRFIRPIEEPLVFPASEGDVIEASVNFEFMYTKLA